MQLVIRNEKVAWLLSLFLLAGLYGCSKGGGNTHKVSGTVTYKGQPVPDVSVIFNPEDGKARPSTAITDASGKFDTVTTLEHGDGVTPGKHKVTLAVTKVSEDPTSRDAYSEKPQGNLPFPSKYLNTHESDAVVDVSKDGQEIKLDLTD